MLPLPALDISVYLGICSSHHELRTPVTDEKGLVQHGVNSAKLSQCVGRVSWLKATGVGGVGGKHNFAKRQLKTA
ncbi:MAG: hypothetical protein RMY34_07290 [Aulosira sp. DedQUE10]|nr:hypothetical protein [Aulosira sp. DedQUE10]